jgi:ABC-2 type transport system permease protein
MGMFTGTGTLSRLVIRRDRVKLPLWMGGILALIAASTSANIDLYPTVADQAAYATTSATSMVSRILAGPITGADIGAIIMVETFLIAAVLVAFMSTLAIVRHTRQNEETGRSELIGSMIVGRHAPLAAALLVVVGANLVVGALATGLLTALLGSEELAGAIAYGSSLAGVGVVFAGVAAVAAQITEGSRAANGIIAAVVGFCFLLRGIGDALGNVAANGVEVVSNGISWLSPLAWGMLMRPFVANDWWVLLLFVGLFAGLVWTAILMTDRRDVGSGMVATRKGPAKAASTLLSPLGLAWRLQRGVFIGWLAAMAITSVGFGVIGKEFESFFEDNDQLAEAFARIGTDDIINGLFAALMGFAGVMVTGYIVQAILRIRAEETGPLETVLATGVSRTRWILSHITIAFGGTLLLLLTSGLLCAVAYSMVTDSTSHFTAIVQGAIVQTPAVLAIGGFAVAVLAAIPRLSIGFAWAGFIISFLIEQLGLLLSLPQWILNISPFTHVPNVPAVAISYAPLYIISGVALALTLLGVYWFKQRDIKPN